MLNVFFKHSTYVLLLQPVQCSVEKKEQGDGTPNVKDQPGQTKKKKTQPKEKSAAEKKLEKR